MTRILTSANQTELGRVTGYWFMSSTSNLDLSKNTLEKILAQIVNKSRYQRRINVTWSQIKKEIGSFST